MQPQPFTSFEQTIIFLVLLGVFAYQGFQRGLVAEIVKLILVLLGIAVGRPAILGDTVVKAVNGIQFTFLFLINGGLKVILSGSFGPEELAAVFEKIADKPPLISGESRAITLFFLMIVLIVAGYLVTRRFKRIAPPLGLIVGAVNGLVLSYLFLPALPGEIPILSTVERVDTGGGISSIGDIDPAIATAPVTALYNMIGTWIVALFILIIVLLALRSMRPQKRRS